MEECAPASLHSHMCSRPPSGADAGERNKRRGGADTAGSETYLEVLEDVLGRWGLALAHCGGKETDIGGTREIFIFLFLPFNFIFYLLAAVVLFCFVVVI